MADSFQLATSRYQEISELLTSARAQVRTAVNTAMVTTYWQIGRIIVEEEQHGEGRAGYGESLLQEISQRLTADFGKGFGLTNIKQMRLFYEAFPARPIRHAVSDELEKGANSLTQNEKQIGHAVSDQFKEALNPEVQEGEGSRQAPALRPELSWTHYRHLLKVKDEKARTWYMDEAASQNWSTRALERQINSLHYERLLSSQDQALVASEAEEKTQALTPQDILRDPYVLEFLQLKEDASYSERELESALIDQLQHFLLELGKGFSFVARQKRITLDGEHFFLDLVFYNYLLKCFVIIDLKLGKLTHQDIGQLDSYVRIYEEHHRGEGDNPTIGLILCSEKNEAVARYSVLADHQTLFASKYQMILPSEDELAKELAKEVQQIERGME